MVGEALPREAEATARHRESELLLRFLQGRASREENRFVVRHLLTRCESCLEVARPLWERLGEAE